MKGKKVTIGWQLPQEEVNTTGVILASAFAGQDALISEVICANSDPEYQFDHWFLLKMLGIVNLCFAEFTSTYNLQSCW